MLIIWIVACVELQIKLKTHENGSSKSELVRNQTKKPLLENWIELLLENGIEPAIKPSLGDKSECLLVGKKMLLCFYFGFSCCESKLATVPHHPWGKESSAIPASGCSSIFKCRPLLQPRALRLLVKAYLKYMSHFTLHFHVTLSCSLSTPGEKKEGGGGEEVQQQIFSFLQGHCPKNQRNRKSMEKFTTWTSPTPNISNGYPFHRSSIPL